jgi:hypothetical protein
VKSGRGWRDLPTCCRPSCRAFPNTLSPAFMTGKGYSKWKDPGRGNTAKGKEGENVIRKHPSSARRPKLSTRVKHHTVVARWLSADWAGGAYSGLQ